MACCPFGNVMICCAPGAAVEALSCCCCVCCCSCMVICCACAAVVVTAEPAEAPASVVVDGVWMLMATPAWDRLMTVAPPVGDCSNRVPGAACKTKQF